MNPHLHHQQPEIQCTNNRLFKLDDQSGKQLEHLDTLFEEFSLEAGERLFNNGEQPRHLFLVKRGLIKLHQLMINGEHRIIRIVRQGDVVGLRGILKDPYRYDASAVVPTRMCRIEIDELMKICIHNPWIRRRVYQHWQTAIDQTSSWLVDLSTGSSKSRVAHLLLKLAAPGSNRICFMPTRQEMASMLGLKSETVSRIYSEFNRTGYVIKLPPKRAALDIQALQAIAQKK